MDKYFPLLALIPLLPACGALFNGLFGKKVPKAVVHWVGCGTIGASFLIALIGLKTILTGGVTHGEHTLYPELTFRAYEWFASGNLSVDIAFMMDPLSAVMCLVVTGVGFLIHVYSIGYMAEDKSYSRYFAYLNLFAFAMLILVLAEDMVLMFVGWEGVGLASYLLIGFWFSDPEKAQAGKKAFIVNRIGDFGFLVGLFILFAWTQSFDFSNVQLAVEGMDPAVQEQFIPFATVICLLLFVGCCGKSAQIPLYVWLPDAMAGPTPVSALIHAATMVTAGVYLIARMSFLFDIAPVAGMTVAIVGCLTALMAATIGILQRDIKKVLAYSTVSQLGYMFMAVGVGAIGAGIFHLMTHAFFKALLFLGAGAVIYAVHHEQDIFKMGGLRKKIPIVHWTFLIACLAISGVPLLSGFFSKDEILYSALARDVGPGLIHTMIWLTATATATITAFYMFRLYFKTFCGEYRGDKHTYEHLHDPPVTMDAVLVVLAILAIIGGYIGIPLFLGGGNHFHSFLHQSITETGFRFEHSAAVVWEWTGMFISIAAAGAGILGAWWLYIKNPELPEKIATRFKRTYDLVFNKYYVDEAYEKVIVRPLYATGRFLFKVVDRVFIDAIMVEGTAFLARSGGRIVRIFQNGDVQRYAFFIIFGLSITLFIVYLG